MSDLIDRQAAIDSIEKHLRFGDELYPLTDTDKVLNHAFEIAASCVYNLPSAQPDLSGYSDKLWKAAYERGKAEAQQRWIPCSERLPENTVLATIETKTFKHRYACEAVWIPRWTWRADFDNWEDCSEYNEDEDEFYVLEGWYERVHNWDEYSYVRIEDNVIAWMPLPEPYRGEGEK